MSSNTCHPHAHTRHRFPLGCSNNHVAFLYLFCVPGMLFSICPTCIHECSHEVAGGSASTIRTQASCC